MPARARNISVWRLIPPLLIAMAVALIFRDVEETDVYWHIRMGAHILESGTFGGDPRWIYGPGDSGWVTTQWLSEVLLHLAHSTLGWQGIALLRALAGAAFLVSIMFAVRSVLPAGMNRDEVARAQSVILILAFAAGQFFMQERPQMATFILLPWLGAMALRLLYTGKWPRWWIVGIFAVGWAWFHGGALVIAPVLVVAFTLNRFILHRKEGWFRSFLTGVPALSIAAIAPALSPAGAAYYKQAYLIQDASKRYIYEWAPSDTDSIYFIVWSVLLGAWVLSTIVGPRSSRPAVLLEGAWLASLFVLSITAFRYVPVAFLLAAPLVARRIAIAYRGKPPQTPIKSTWGHVIVAAACVGMLALVVTRWSGIQGAPITDPNRLWDSLAATNGERRVLVDYNMSGKTQMLTREGVVVSIDGRSDRYGPWIDDYLNMFNGKSGWEETYNQNYSTSTDAIVEDDSAFVEFLTELGWRVNCVSNGYTWLSAPGYEATCVPEALSPGTFPAT